VTRVQMWQRKISNAKITTKKSTRPMEKKGLHTLVIGGESSFGKKIAQGREDSGERPLGKTAQVPMGTLIGSKLGNQTGKLTIATDTKMKATTYRRPRSQKKAEGGLTSQG